MTIALRISLTVLCATICALASPGHAQQQYPAKPIRLIVPFGTGGAADAVARLIADHLASELRQPVVIENRTGAGGVLAASQVARAEPDGHTLLMSGVAPQVIAPAINPTPGYDPDHGFTNIAYIGGPPIVWVVTPSTDMHSLDDVLRNARDGKLSGYASSGVGTLGHLVSEFVIQKAGIKLDHIPYNTASMADILAGHVTLGSYAWGAVLGLLQAKSLRPIAVTTEKRMPGFDDLPTFRELGFDLVASTWFSLAGPAGLPRDVTDRLNRTLATILALPDVRRRLDQDAIEPKTMTPEELTAFVATETARWRPVVTASGLARKP